jgi:hypothetical protein
MPEATLDLLVPGFGEATDPDVVAKSKLKTASTPEEAAKFEPGTEFLDPAGKKRIVPFRPKTIEETESLPEGSQFVDPEGKLRQTPTYEGLNFTTQTLYNMAATDKEREKALERGYPGKVKRRPSGELYVEEDGKLRRSKGVLDAPGAFAASQAAPVLGSVIGEIGGGVAGSVIPGAGTFVGAVGGGAIGGGVGQGFNDAILALAGVYDRSAGQEAAEVGLATATGGVGTAAGRVIAGAAPAIKDVVKNVAPKFANWVAGTDKEALQTGIGLREQGVLVPPGPMFPELPHVINVVEVFDPAFHTQKPLLQSATDYYERTGTELLKSKEIGVPKPGKIVDPEAAVSTEKAGESVLASTRAELSAKDAALQAAFDARRSAAQAGLVESGAGLQTLAAADQEARAAADKVIAEGFSNIQGDIDKAMKVAKAGYNSGDLWNSVGKKLQAIKIGISQRANIRYAQADELAAGHLPDVSGLPEMAEHMLAQMPEGFEGKYPGIIKQIRDIAGVPKLDEAGNATGEWVKEPVNPTFGQLHNLRTVLRNSVNYYDLTPDFREGSLKFFANRVNEALHDINAVPELRAAAKFLDETDKWYGKTIKPLTDKNIQAVLSGLESGLPADPKKLYDVLIREGRTELTNKVRKMVGPSLWGGIKAADIREMLDATKTLTPGEIDGRQFVKQVLDRHRTGMLEAVHGKEANRLMEQARRIEQLSGRLPVRAMPGDTVSTILARARDTAEAVKAAAKQDPLSTLGKEMKLIQRDQMREAAKMRAQRQNDPLAFLYNPTTGAHEAVSKILGHEDLIIAAAAKFGENSPEFNLLRQVWAERLLTGTLQPSKRLEKVSEEVQRIMFPGVSLDSMKLLAKNMDFLMSARSASMDPGAGLSMAATAKVEHPFGALPGGRTLGKALNIVTLGLGDPVARTILGSYYKMIRNVVNNPAFLRWMEKGLKGDERARQMVKEEMQKRMQRGGAVGAGMAQSQFQTPNQNLPMSPPQQPSPGAQQAQQ